MEEGSSTGAKGGSASRVPLPVSPPVSRTSPAPRRGGQPPWALPSTPSGSPSSLPPELARRLGLGSCRLRTRHPWKGNRAAVSSQRDTGAAPTPSVLGQGNERGGGSSIPLPGLLPRALVGSGLGPPWPTSRHGCLVMRMVFHGGRFSTAAQSSLAPAAAFTHRLASSWGKPSLGWKHQC